MKIHIVTSGFDLTNDLERYTRRKLVRLTKKVPRADRVRALCEVRFVQIGRKGKKFNSCTVSLALDDAKLRSNETTLHMYTALDIAIVHMERQLTDHLAMRHKQSLITRIRRHLRRDWL